VFAAARHGDSGRARRLALPVSLLLGEYLFLSSLVDLPRAGAGLHWVAWIRMAVPVSLGTVAAGWLLSRARGTRGAPTGPAEVPPWRPWPGVLANLAVFGLAVGLAWRELGPGAPLPTSAALLALLALGGLAALFAAMTAGPLPWLLVRLRPLVGILPAAMGLGLVTWWITAQVEGTWGALSAATLRAVGALLRAAGGEVTLLPDESVVGLKGFEAQIGPECSGVDGMGLVLLFQGIWLSLARDRIRLPLGLLLLPLGAAAAFVANAVRIAVLVWVGALGRVDLAVGVLHSKLGWILFVALALASVALAEHAPWLWRNRGGASASEKGGVPAEVAVYLGPLVAALATALATSALANGPLDPWYGARIVAAAVALVALRRSLPSLRPSPSVVPALLGALVAVTWIALSRGDGEPLASALAGLPAPARLGWIACRALGSIAVIPVAEELAFRGFLLPWLVSPDLEKVPPRAWTWPALLLSSVAFGAIHSQVLLATGAGLAFAVARLWRGRLGDAVVAHAVANAGVALAVLAGGRWHLWG